MSDAADDRSPAAPGASGGKTFVQQWGVHIITLLCILAVRFLVLRARRFTAADAAARPTRRQDAEPLSPDVLAMHRRVQIEQSRIEAAQRRAAAAAARAAEAAAAAAAAATQEASDAEVARVAAGDDAAVRLAD